MIVFSEALPLLPDFPCLYTTIFDKKKSCLAFKMRPLTDSEMQAVLKKLAEYTGASLKNLIAPDSSPKADRNVFRLSKSRVFCVRLSIANLATSIARDKLLSLGTCLGRRRSLKSSATR
jgi:60S ribosome subunit biogenesis protein NIP7